MFAACGFGVLKLCVSLQWQFSQRIEISLLWTLSGHNCVLITTVTGFPFVVRACVYFITHNESNNIKNIHYTVSDIFTAHPHSVTQQALCWTITQMW